MCAEGDKMHAEGAEMCAEGDKVWAEGSKMCAEGDKMCAELLIESYGNIKLEWKNWNAEYNSCECHIENGDVYGFPPS